MRYSEFITEATRPYVEKIIDPALMTFGEYLKIADPDGKMHPSTAYDYDVERLNRYETPEEYQKLLNTITKNGITFEVREKQIDRWDNNYVKTDENREIVRDENGKAQYLSKEEIALMIPPEKRYTYEFAVVRKDTNEIVGNTSDEWGALLVTVAEEYRNFGFGTLLVKLKREREPTKGSGGFTNAGLNNFRRVHTAMVREYMSSGMYSHLVNTGILTKERAKEIINSISKNNKKPTQKNLNTTNPEDWLLMTDSGQSYAILYDKKIYQLDKDYIDTSDYWVEKFIIGMVGIGGPDNFNTIDRTYGSIKVVGKLVGILINGEYPKPIYLEQDMFNIVKTTMGDNLNNEKITKENRTMYKCWVDSPTVNISGFMMQENNIRKKYDQYDELKVRIQELAESLAN